ncbi:hypothetical protein HAHE_31900 [Haloferula helveola]|uniref:Planctomycete cytochrome C n=1 Tax=Haloferula helveola TaxID=490095 RepID=A0ABM7RG47_9BACT|nr:hypothetical protein HAHE_31900 [Haloferula helveola]
MSKSSALLIPCLLATATAGFGDAPNFRRDIQPILESNCVRCHKEGKAKGNLRMETHAAMMEGGDEGFTIVPGKPDESELILRTHLRPIDEGFMPDEGQALTSEQLALLTEWVRTGANWPEGVVLEERKPTEVKRVAIPDRAPKDLAEAAVMLDDILKRENADEEVVTTPTIGSEAFLRRATVDLIGRIPTMEEIKRFESWGPDRREKLVDELLKDPRFADRWTIFMADMMRIRSNVTGGNQLLAYVNKSLAKGKPYDEMVRELIAASGKPNANPAVGYILGDDTNPMELAAATSQVFLGVRIGCAMCHDHPFDDWEQKDFYELAAFFGKTKQVQSRQRGMVYTTEGHEMTVLWPPEDKAEADQRRPVTPAFPFSEAEFETPPHWVKRFEEKRAQAEVAAKEGEKDASLDALLDSIEPTVGRESDPVLEEAKKESRDLEVLKDIYRASELRNQLAAMITDPRNPYFARAFVNRVWAELIGRGFVEPLDNFSDYNEMRHASTLDFLSHEFVASGYDLKSLIKIIMLSDAYQRSHLSADVGVVQREASEKHFAAAPVRRMLSEVLYDSVVVAGHLDDFKWPAGANMKEIVRQVRVPTGEMVAVTPDSSDEPAEMAPKMPMPKRGDGYDLESSLSLDFNSILSPKEKAELDTMKMKSDEQIEAEKMAAMQKEKQSMVMKYRIEEQIDKVDDNPRFDSAMRMATPAPPAHFLRVFGQPARDGLGQFREEFASLRQELMMMNGRLTHEASRVGPMEPLNKLMEFEQHDRAIEWAYREILTRTPTSEETADALEILKSAPTPRDGMADLRWALLNSHEFRFLP